MVRLNNQFSADDKQKIGRNIFGNFFTKYFRNICEIYNLLSTTETIFQVTFFLTSLWSGTKLFGSTIWILNGLFTKFSPFEFLCQSACLRVSFLILYISYLIFDIYEFQKILVPTFQYFTATVWLKSRKNNIYHVCTVGHVWLIKLLFLNFANVDFKYSK